MSIVKSVRVRRRPGVLLDPTPRVWMETLERRVCLSAAVAGVPAVNAADPSIPAGYFREWGVGSVPASAAPPLPYDWKYLDVGSGPTLTATLATFWGDMPRVDRAYVQFGYASEGKPMPYFPMELVDVPGPTFEARVSDLPMPAATATASWFTFYNDHGGADYALVGPTMVHGEGTFVPFDVTHTIQLNDGWVRGHVRMPTLLDRRTGDGLNYRVGLDWHDGTGVQWSPRDRANGWQEYDDAERDDPRWHRFSLNVRRDFHTDRQATLVIDGLNADGSVDPSARVQVEMAFDVTHLEENDRLGIGYGGEWTPPPPAKRLPYGFYQSRSDAFQVIGQTFDSLDDFDTFSELPADTVARIDWDDGTTESTIPRLKSPRSADTDEVSQGWIYGLDVRPHIADAGAHRARVTLISGNSSVSGTYAYIGVEDRMQRSRYIYDQPTVGATIEEGVGGEAFMYAFLDGSTHGPSDYNVSVTLDDGTQLPARVRTGPGDWGKDVLVDLPPLWNPSGYPSHYSDETSPVLTGTMTLERSGQRIVKPVRINFNSDTWIAPSIAADGLHDAVPALRLVDVAGDASNIFLDRRGSIAIDVSTAVDLDAAELSVSVAWDRTHTTAERAVRVGPGRYQVRVDHAYPSPGLKRIRVGVTYGDTTWTLDRNVRALEAADVDNGLLVQSNPTIANIAAGYDWGRADVGFGSVSFVDLKHLEPQEPGEPSVGYDAVVRFDDGSPARAMIFSDGVAQHIYVFAFLAKAGPHPFELTIRAADGREMHVRCLAQAGPRPPTPIWDTDHAYFFSVVLAENGTARGWGTNAPLEPGASATPDPRPPIEDVPEATDESATDDPSADPNGIVEEEPDEPDTTAGDPAAWIAAEFAALDDDAERFDPLAFENLGRDEDAVWELSVTVSATE